MKGDPTRNFTLSKVLVGRLNVVHISALQTYNFVSSTGDHFRKEANEQGDAQQVVTIANPTSINRVNGFKLLYYVVRAMLHSLLGKRNIGKKKQFRKKCTLSR
jgi:hypothetical protein